MAKHDFHDWLPDGTHPQQAHHHIQHAVAGHIFFRFSLGRGFKQDQGPQPLRGAPGDPQAHKAPHAEAGEVKAVYPEGIHQRQRVFRKGIHIVPTLRHGATALPTVVVGDDAVG